MYTQERPTPTELHGAIILPEDSTVITDAEEEIFLIYTELQGAPPEDPSNLRGLGYLDSKHDIVELNFELTPPLAAPAIGPARAEPGPRKRKIVKRTTSVSKNTSFEYQLLQDKTALHSRKGDTGSVVWKASIDLGRYVLQEHVFPSRESLFDNGKLKECHIVELGAGTGLLGVILSQIVKKYTVTDTADLASLIQKNIKHNFKGWPDLAEGTPGSNIAVEPLDWVLLHQSPEPYRRKLLSNIPDPIDILLVVDCIYHPNLVPPLLAAIDHLAQPNITRVIVLSELRSEEVPRLFLENWLGLPGWKVWHVGGDLLHSPRYVLWMGEKLSV